MKIYGIVLVRIIHNTTLYTTKHLHVQVAGYRILKNFQNLIVSLTACLTASLTTVARLEAKRSSAHAVTIFRRNNTLTSGMCLLEFRQV